jgi:tellurium resistance protein TerD
MVECKLFEVRPVVQKIIFIVTIHKATQKNQNFGSLQSSYIRLYDGKSNGEIFRYQIDVAGHAQDTSVEFGCLERIGVDWVFNAVTRSHEGTFKEIATSFRRFVLPPGTYFPVDEAVRSACFSIGWDQPCKEDDAVDVDVYIFGLDKNQKCFADYHVYFGQLETEDGAVLHLGDTQTASTDRGDDETVEICIGLMDPQVMELVFMVTIYDPGQVKGYHLGYLPTIYIKYFDKAIPSKELFRFDVDGDQLEGAWALEMGRLKRVQKRSKKGVVEEESWHFVSTGAANKMGLDEMYRLLGCTHLLTEKPGHRK